MAGSERQGGGRRRQSDQSALACHRSSPAEVRRGPATKWTIYWLNEKIAFSFGVPEDPSFHVRDAGAPAGNGFSVFVVQRRQKMKFAVRLSEVIYSHKGVFFISSSAAVNARCVIKHVRRILGGG